ncbi:Lrp/AsnC family transcriptional regulator [Brevibacillus daliensis]|uniref:Lrp/AsnC family transcriptional regulator n=1 Tax=Brevibacillus daliensis TaxID=2892995 RepID=UPI001E35F8A4|nr:Lrp/AsnC family transcriptional regulator [Brevibacillus daliensis]
MDQSTTKKLLMLLEENCRLSSHQLGLLLDCSEEEIEAEIKRLQAEKIIVKYPALINWERVQDNPLVTAMIDVKVTPVRDIGFEKVAERIARFPEVKAVYLMSGAGYDISVLLEGKTMHEIANFVTKKLAPLDNVVSTATHFILKRYKHDGTILEDYEDDRRMVVTP